jgi:hypothetical protein
VVILLSCLHTDIKLMLCVFDEIVNSKAVESSKRNCEIFAFVIVSVDITVLVIARGEVSLDSLSTVYSSYYKKVKLSSLQVV